MSQISSKHKSKELKAYNDREHHRFFSRIRKTLYYGKLPKTDRLSLPVTELTAELFSQAKIGHSLERLHLNDAAEISRNACVSPCSLILAMLYLERLKSVNPEYLQRVAPSELFLVTLMISSKFLYDDGEDDEVFMDEWARSGGITAKELVQLEKEFLNAINWEIYVNEINFWDKLKTLEMMLAKKEGFNRGWLTYTELDVLVERLDIDKLFKIAASCFTVLLTTYTAGLLTIIGSMFIVSQIPGNCLQIKSCSYNPTAMNNSSSLELNYNDIEHDVAGARKSIDALDVLHTGLILATIQPSQSSEIYEKEHVNSNETSNIFDDNMKNSEFDTTSLWWNSPTMIWLSKTSKLMEMIDFVPKYNLNSLEFDVYYLNCKKIELQDHVHRATKVRIQDQMETSWHVEWTDSIFNYNPLSIFQTAVIS